MYRDLRALGVSVCFTRFMKKIERDSLLISALVLALKFRCSSKCIPRSLKDLRLGLAWELWIRSISKISSGLKGGYTATCLAVQRYDKKSSLLAHRLSTEFYPERALLP